MPHCLVVANAIAVKSNKYTTRRILKDGRFLADLLPLHSMIGYWHHPVVRPSVCPSICLSVTLCILTLRVGVHCTGLKVTPACS